MNTVAKVNSQFGYDGVKFKRWVALDICDGDKKLAYASPSSNLELSLDDFKKTLKERRIKYKCIKAEIDLKDSRVCCIDFDEKYHTQEWIEQHFPFLVEADYTEGNTKGFHYFVVSDYFKNKGSETKVNQTLGDIDLISGHIWMNPEDVCDLLVDRQLKTIDLKDIKNISPNFKEMVEDKLPKEVSQIIYEINNKEVKELLDIIDDKRADDGGDWSKIVASLKSENLEDMARAFSQRSDKYDEFEFDEKWTNSNELSIGIVHNFAKTDNPEKYKDIIYKHRYSGLRIHNKDINDSYSLLEKICEPLFEILKYANDKWYTLDDENMWKQIKEPSAIIMKMVRKGLNNTRKYLNKKLDDDEDNKELLLENQKILDAFAKIDKPGFCSQAKKHAMTFLEDDKFPSKLDKNPYKIVFNNGIYDIKTDTFVEGILPQDFVTKKLDFDYVEGTDEEEEKFIKDQFYKIMNCNYEHMEYLFSVLGYALSGDASKYQEFYTCIGQLAGNGKSALFEFMSKAYPTYVTNVDTEVLEADYQKKHKKMPQFANHRIVYLNEMKKHKKLDVKQFKIIADGGTYENEVMYGTSTTFDIQAKAFLLSNHTIDFDSTDKGAERRLRHLQFDGEFREKYEDDYENKRFKADPEFPKKLFDRRLTFLKMLLERARNVYKDGMPKIPDEFAEELDQALESNNTTINWFKENLSFEEDEKTCKQEIIDKIKGDIGVKITAKDLSDYMKQLGFQKYYNKNNKKVYLGSTRRGVYNNILLKQEENKDELDFVEDP
jgi:phage/plasmid-associated DNA primase